MLIAPSPSSSRHQNWCQWGQVHRRSADVQLVADTVEPREYATLSFHFPLPLAQMPIAPSPLLENYIGDDGAMHIAEALMCNSSLTELDLSGVPPSHFIPIPIAADTHRTIPSSRQRNWYQWGRAHR